MVIVCQQKKKLLSHSASAFVLKMEQTAVLEDGVTQGKTQLESDYSIQYGGTLAQSSASSPHTHTHQL
jgi:hypothetical protein